MITSNWKEAKKNRLEITDIPFEVVKSAVDFLYEHDVKESITEANAADYLQFADKYNVEHFQVSTFSRNQKLLSFFVCFPFCFRTLRACFDHGQQQMFS